MSATISRSGCLLRLVVRSIVASGDRLHNQSATDRTFGCTSSGKVVRQIGFGFIPSLYVTPDHTISRLYDWLRFGQGATDRQCLLRSPVAVAYYDWSYDQSSHPATDRTTNLQPIVRLVVPAVAKSCDKSGQVKCRHTTGCHVIRCVAPPIVRWDDQLYDQQCQCVICDHRQLLVRPRTTGGTIT